ncbi:hypothetical protein ACFU8W_44270 [Streptomyces sp. NPDC057565]|uniref:hypothetical protein n=1 Tax=Streptomyces sp. NPDC057565 TaxID=3346169 RepID=UPI00369FC06E
MSDCFIFAADDPYQPYQDSGGLIEVLTSAQFVAAAIVAVIAVCLLVSQIVSRQRERSSQQPAVPRDDDQ